jgi:hypothetical protein
MIDYDTVVPRSDRRWSTMARPDFVPGLTGQLVGILSAKIWRADGFERRLERMVVKNRAGRLEFIMLRDFAAQLFAHVCCFISLDRRNKKRRLALNDAIRDSRQVSSVIRCRKLITSFADTEFSKFPRNPAILVTCVALDTRWQRRLTTSSFIFLTNQTSKTLSLNRYNDPSTTRLLT